jgi:hypothetical protein
MKNGAVDHRPTEPFLAEKNGSVTKKQVIATKAPEHQGAFDQNYPILSVSLSLGGPT